ncbi:MAG: bifunctional ornithine acetyltransferase/N-acetylglutamate synthase, partial [Gammaproteobacteria bacterium]
MLDKKFSPARQSAFDARFEAQKIAFGPVVFQCVRYAWKRGMLQALADAGGAGLSVAELAATGRWSEYALKLVLETCLSAGVVYLEGGRYVLDKAGFCVLTDSITQINIDFNHDVCYEGLFKLDESLDQEKPIGLKALGDWPTVYQGLSQLPEPAKRSWFAFDHFYSDTSFPEILPDVFATAPKRVMDVGANTGKFSCAALGYHPSVELHLVDLPRQLAVAEQALIDAGVRERAHLHPTDLLDFEHPLPANMDVIWMSQFLSCFSEAAIATILRRAAAALAPGAGQDAAAAIMTTDTVPKIAHVTHPDGWSVGGMAKGAGMLAPGLATMLSVLTTDAPASAAQLDEALRAAVARTYDRVDSDGCMSTN